MSFCKRSRARTSARPQINSRLEEMAVENQYFDIAAVGTDGLVVPVLEIVTSCSLKLKSLLLITQKRHEVVLPFRHAGWLFHNYKWWNIWILLSTQF